MPDIIVRRNIPNKFKKKKRSRPSNKQVKKKITFRSKFEVSVAKDLESRGISFEFESLIVPYTLHCTYKPDFLLPNGIIVETKGVLDADVKRKMLAAKLQNKELDIRFLFMSSTSKKNKVKWERWCRNNNYEYAYDVVPESWLEE